MARVIAPTAALLGLAGLPLAGCGAGERPASAPVVRDSAGVTIVENSAPIGGAAGVVVISAEPLLEIGVLEGDEAYQLDGVVGATRLSDGRLVVANRGSAELRIYDPSGRHLRSSGGKGGGPGEFQFMGAPLRMAGDTLLVADQMSGRLSIFSGAGDFLTSHTARMPAGVLSDGTLVGHRTVRAPGDGVPSGLIREPEALVRYTLAGEELDTLGVVPGTERNIHVEQSGGTISSISISTPLFGRSLQVAVAPDRVYAGSADSYEIEVYLPGRGLERLIRIMRPLRTVTSSMVEERKQRELADVPDAERRRDVERRYSGLTPPDYLPAYGAFRVDALGHLWVAEYQAPGESEPRWELFDQDGRWLTTVETPKGFRIVEIGEDYLLGVWRDEFDVEYLRLYGLERRGAGA